MSFLACGPAIVTRLSERLSKLTKPISVETAVDAGAVLDSPQQNPIVYVLFDGFEPTQSVGNGRIQQIEQRWAVVIKLRKLSGTAVAGDPIAYEADPVITAVIAALCGHRAAEGFDPLQLDEGSGGIMTAGYAYHQLVFTTRTTVRGEP